MTKSDGWKRSCCEGCDGGVATGSTGSLLFNASAIALTKSTAVVHVRVSRSSCELRSRTLYRREGEAAMARPTPRRVRQGMMEV